MRAYARAAAVAALLAVVAAPAASFARPVSPGQCTIKYYQVTSEPLPGGLGEPYLDCTY